MGGISLASTQAVTSSSTSPVGTSSSTLPVEPSSSPQWAAQESEGELSRIEIDLEAAFFVAFFELAPRELSELGVPFEDVPEVADSPAHELAVGAGAPMAVTLGAMIEMPAHLGEGQSGGHIVGGAE